tara:strand:- start:720 stop:1226 length:507 start_codon:yes stop_codon:yes gene_type:complete
MLIRRTSYVANVFTHDWNTTTNLFFQGAVHVPHKPVGKPGPLNVRLRLFAAHTDIQSAVTLTFEKEKIDTNGNLAYDTAPGSVAKGLPGGANGTYDAANPVYADEDFKWIIGKTFVWGDGSTDHYGAYVYYQFKDFKTESLGRYKAKAQITYDSGTVNAETTFEIDND